MLLKCNNDLIIVAIHPQLFNSQIIKTIKKWTKATRWILHSFMTEQFNCILNCFKDQKPEYFVVQNKN